ncbi:hypothetical protein C6I21_01410 [Alkalicoccus urumqiensis]|uniref:Uncharacterized protein n=1 Tax=Alkalicoccus urumqiensis TaxID=1548213 RepID=A0A2P6MLS2_ALKUR|nr:hypothetical protein C6I21_01410 [Alkalicoccus urumqiensis]
MLTYAGKIKKEKLNEVPSKHGAATLPPVQPPPAFHCLHTLVIQQRTCWKLTVARPLTCPIWQKTETAAAVFLCQEAATTRRKYI